MPNDKDLVKTLKNSPWIGPELLDRLGLGLGLGSALGLDPNSSTVCCSVTLPTQAVNPLPPAAALHWNPKLRPYIEVPGGRLATSEKHTIDPVVGRLGLLSGWEARAI